MKRWTSRASAIALLGAGPSLGACDGVSPTSRGPVVEATPLVVSTRTTGGSFDMTGFEVWVDGAFAGDVGPNDSLGVTGLVEGLHVVELRRFGDTCRMRSAHAFEIEIVRGSTLRSSFSVACDLAAELADTRILFLEPIGGVVTLVSSNVDGDHRSLEVELPDGFDFDFDPERRRMLFHRRDDGAPHPVVFVRDFGASEPVLLRADVYGARWSPDGTEIAYATADGWWGGSIHVMNADGSGVRRLTGLDGSGEDVGPTWSPDGRSLAFVRAEGAAGSGPLRLWSVDRDGGDERRLSTHANVGSWAWSRADGRIAYAVSTPSRVVVRVTPEDGGASEPLYTLRAGSRVDAVDWSRDGAVLFLTLNDGMGDVALHALRVADRAIVRLTDGDDWRRYAWVW